MNYIDKIAFVDETGDEQLKLEHDNVSDYYILSAVVIDDIAHDGVTKQFENLRKKYFKSNEIKSTLRSLKNNPGKREDILNDLAKIDFSLYLYVVNKKEINRTSGLQYPKSFIKYFHGQFYNRIKNDYTCVNIVVDKIKGAKFQEEFSKYIKMKFDVNGPRLFYPISFDSVDSKTNICVQIADFIAGTVALSFEEKTTVEWHQRYKQILGKHVVDFYIFPEILTSYVVSEPHKRASDFDEQIENRSLYNSSEFIKEHIDSQDEKRQMQVYCLQKLRDNYFQEGKHYWLQTDALLECFNSEWGVNTPQVLRGIIGQLRDAGNLIVSRHSGGYKLAVSKSDYCEFLNVMNTQISPMIARIERARNSVCRATDNKIDILDEPEYQNLKAIVNLNCKWMMVESESENFQ